MSTTLNNFTPAPAGKVVLSLSCSPRDPDKALRPLIGHQHTEDGSKREVLLGPDGTPRVVPDGDICETFDASDARRVDPTIWTANALHARDLARSEAAHADLRAEVEAHLREHRVVSGAVPAGAPAAVRAKLAVLADLVAAGIARYAGHPDVLAKVGSRGDAFPTNWPGWAAVWLLNVAHGDFRPDSGPDLVVALSDQVRDGVYPVVGHEGRHPVVLVRQPHTEPRAVVVRTGKTTRVGAFDSKKWIAEAHDAATVSPEVPDPIGQMLARLHNELAVTPSTEAERAVLDVLRRDGRARRVESAYVLNPS